MSSNRRFKYEPITIKEPHKEEVKIFENTDEFTQYYRSHEDEFGKVSSDGDGFKHVSTLILNRTYKIPGYRITITKRGTENEELQLKKDYYSGTKIAQTIDNNNENLIKLLDEIKLLSQRIDNIEHFLSQE
jgi:hypothetical protein